MLFKATRNNKVKKLGGTKMNGKIMKEKEVRIQVSELETGQRLASVQDLVVALVDVYVRLGRIWPEMATRWYAEGLLGGGDWKYVTLLGEIYNELGEIAEYFDTGLDLIPDLLEKYGEEQESEHCPVCRYFRQVTPGIKDCWYCHEGFGETDELASYRETAGRLTGLET